MTTKKTGTLGAGLIATKGAAAPTVEAAPPASKEQSAKEVRTAITVKLLQDTYLRMKMYGATNKVSNQDFIEAAIIERLERLNA